MNGLHPIGGGLDAVIVGTAAPTPEERLQRYAAAVAARPCRWFTLRVQFGQILQRSLKSGIQVGYAAWQRQMPALWPRVHIN
ncbi:hypothetical protein JAK49_06235 [Stenotrophomonas maltophilia]|uniref:hypothetical protein n=1 Tax=Stenotrophomonas maltophilia TaxID=40324 RepID=UPI000D3F0FA6|nr:hypothetical protein [Stenotrophomonas maltophilia]MCF3495735.1 hypothetical protein [Stenotrophomonas maltophilia]MCU1153559.1 hypothetical protein [Stenotrophomonas maltophilia]MCU1213072.1 hypothetical protein [Stenotrophomonas maltophilia]PSD20181.1 hypothetical protein C7E15_06905 [Stenotrophomonas maltophilia]